MKAASSTAFALALMMGAALSLPLPALAAEQRTLSMGGHGEAKAAPDLVSINAGVTTSAPTAAAALSANTTRMKGVFAALTRLGVPEKNIQTVNFSISPQYANNRENNEAPRVTGYQVNNQVSVLLEDVSRLGGALDALVTAGANQMHGINFSIKEPAPLLAKARADAIADARLRAETYARAAGVTLGPIQSISESGGVVMPYRADRMMMAAAPKAVPVAAGEESVTADVSVVWEIQ
ncbi:MAG TPA: SIMPL domain-containing protein [Rhizomicrobium sp.]|nr:SIMPL domain-containing protein [Rhizomicrobium sp.]